YSSEREPPGKRRSRARMEFKSVTVVRDSKELSQMAELMPGNFESTGRIGFVASTLTVAVEAAGSMRPSRFAASEARLSRAGCGLRAGALSGEPPSTGVLRWAAMLSVDVSSHSETRTESFLHIQKSSSIETQQELNSGPSG